MTDLLNADHSGFLIVGLIFSRLTTRFVSIIRWNELNYVSFKLSNELSDFEKNWGRKEWWTVRCWTQVRACRMHLNYFNGNIHWRVLIENVEKKIEVTRRGWQIPGMIQFYWITIELNQIHLQMNEYFLRTYNPLQDKILWIVIIESVFDRISSCFAQRVTNYDDESIIIIDNHIS